MADQPGGETTKTARERRQEISVRMSEIESLFNGPRDPAESAEVFHSAWIEYQQLKDEKELLYPKIAREIMEDHIVKEAEKYLSYLPMIEKILGIAQPQILQIVKTLLNESIGMAGDLKEEMAQMTSLRAKAISGFLANMEINGLGHEDAMRIILASIGKPGPTITIAPQLGQLFGDDFSAKL